MGQEFFALVIMSLITHSAPYLNKIDYANQFMCLSASQSVKESAICVNMLFNYSKTLIMFNFCSQFNRICGQNGRHVGPSTHSAHSLVPSNIYPHTLLELLKCS